MFRQVKKELLVLVWACDKFQWYLVGILVFKILTDRKTLVSLMNDRDFSQARTRCHQLLLCQIRFLFWLSLSKVVISWWQMRCHARRYRRSYQWDRKKSPLMLMQFDSIRQSVTGNWENLALPWRKCWNSVCNTLHTSWMATTEVKGIANIPQDYP